MGVSNGCPEDARNVRCRTCTALLHLAAQSTLPKIHLGSAPDRLGIALTSGIFAQVFILPAQICQHAPFCPLPNVRPCRFLLRQKLSLARRDISSRPPSLTM